MLNATAFGQVVLFHALLMWSYAQWSLPHLLQQ
jgi:hypothetical protein